ncbi:Flavanone 7-O-glucoside 2''-O-beta-L-rhamnosyltransferase [Apostasia shenzhenica]|uniref:Glycosyltransferase n=1 Tax=Apostasia shenzhenica TaxID=1088818 RepID=A0A2I0APA2_9ASPA|nr:Flavanone 7-O-glucoside 2''-O-beta-L-rhamnosyltransferase [Apostasia shenzhenica]
MAAQGTQPRLRVLMLPWLAYGHLSPFLELAKRLSLHNVAVYLCSSPTNFRPIAAPASSAAVGDSVPIRMVDLPLPDLPDLPPHLHTTKDLPPHLMPTLKAAVDGAAPAFGLLLDELCPDIVFFDFVMPWVPLVAAVRDIPAVVFFANSAATTTLFFQHLRRPAEQPPFPAIAFEGGEKELALKMLSLYGNGQLDADRILGSIDRSSGFTVFRTFREIEAKYLDYLPSLLNREVIPVGPLVPSIDGEESYLEEWLGKKEAASVVFVSLGSEYFMSPEEISEMARGLELCKLCFIWVVRSPSTDRPATAALPENFAERMEKEGRGVVVQGWAPQRKILAHRSTGGFVTHCGWSSVVEGMSLGVPMIAVPLQHDQPVNANLMAELGVAVKVKMEVVVDGETGEPVNRFRGDDVARCIEEVVVGEGGAAVRRRVKEMGEMMKGKGDEEMEILVEKMDSLVRRKKKTPKEN